VSDPSVPQTETLPERCPSRTQCQHRRGHVGLHDYDDAAGTLGLDLDALAGALEAFSDDDLELVLRIVLAARRCSQEVLGLDAA
jgi:hypothetical protein